MPELPEVETIANDLDRVLRGEVFSKIELIDKSKVLQTPFPQFKKKLVGARIKKVFRRAKMLVIETNHGLIIFHLKMTGQLIYVHKNKYIAGGHPIQSTGVNVPNTFTRLLFKFTNKGSLYFNDVRKFGWVKLVQPDEFTEISAKVGIEPLEKEFTLKFFETMLSRRGRVYIKAVLLEQKYLSGLGNIYVDEVLFRSKIRPTRSVESLRKLDIQKLWQSIPIILCHSIKERGTTFSNFIDASGQRGNFMKHLKVYGRGGKPCVICKKPLRKTRVAGRGSHWCEKCQK